MKRNIPDITKFSFKLKDQMAYDTPDDFDDQGHFELYSKMDKLERLAVGVHALIEFVLAKLQGVSAKQITKWDTEDSHGAYDPLMYSKNDVYKKAHEYAEEVERTIVEAAGWNWEEYMGTLEHMKIKYDKSKWEKGVK